nr:hypothetical protein CFP56_56480 [Quercus suber]
MTGLCRSECGCGELHHSEEMVGARGPAVPRGSSREARANAEREDGEQRGGVDRDGMGWTVVVGGWC